MSAAIPADRKSMKNATSVIAQTCATGRGHETMSRRKQSGWSGGDRKTELETSTAVACRAWPFRMGKSPWRTPPGEARLEHLRTLAANPANTAKIQHPDVANSDETEVPAITLPDAPNDRRIVKCMGGNR